MFHTQSAGFVLVNIHCLEISVQAAPLPLVLAPPALQHLLRLVLPLRMETDCHLSCQESSSRPRTLLPQQALERTCPGRCTLTPATLDRGTGTVVGRMHSPKWQRCEGCTAVSKLWGSQMKEGKIAVPEEERDRKKYVQEPQMAAITVTSTDRVRKLFHTVTPAL